MCPKSIKYTYVERERVPAQNCMTGARAGAGVQGRGTGRGQLSD